MSLWLLVLGALLMPPPARPAALVGATLVDGRGGAPIAGAVVVIQDGKIACAGKDCRIPVGASLTDVRGDWITPGLIDAHVHFGQTGWADGRPDFIDVRKSYPYEQAEADLAAHPERFFRTDLCSGLTGVYDVGGYPWSIEMARRERDDPSAPRVAAAGPLLATIDASVNLPAEKQFIYMKDPAAAREAVHYLAARGADAVKVWYIVDAEHSVEASKPSVLAAGEEAKTRRLPLIVHATGLAEAKVALEAGATLLVHSVMDVPVDEEFITLAKRNGTVYCPTLTVMSGYVRLAQAAGSGKAPKVDDPNGCVDSATLAHVADARALTAMPPEQVAHLEQVAGDFARLGAANLKRVSDAGIPIAMGTDAGNPLTLHGPSIYAEMEAMQAAGLSPMEVLVAATRGGSFAMGADKTTGTIETGKSADLLVVEADPTKDVANLRRVRFVVRAGVVHPLGELKAARPGPK